MSDEPSTKLYFVKKPTMSSAEYGRKPVIGKMKTVAGRPRKIKEAFGTTEVIEPTATEKLQQQIGRARRRVMERGIFKPVELTPFAEEAREKILAKTIVGQQQAKIEEEKAQAELAQRQAENTAVREAQLALPQLIKRQTLGIQALQPTLQQNLLALQRVAPDIAEQLQLREESPLRGLFEIEEPTEAEASASRKDVEGRETLRRIIQDEGLTDDKDIVKRFKDIHPDRKRMPKGYKDIVSDIKGKGLGFQATTTTGKGRKGIAEGAGFFSDVFKGAKSLAKKGLEKAIEVVKEDPIGTAKKAFEIGQKGREQYAKMFGKKEKGGKMFIPKKHQKIMYKHAKQAHGKGFADMFLKGLITPFSIASKIAEHIPIVGDVIGKVGKAIPSVVTGLTGIKPLI